MNLYKTPLTFRLETILEGDFSCSERLDYEDLIYALYLNNKDLKEFLKCFNDQYNFSKKAILYKKIPIKISKELSRSFKFKPLSNQRTDEMLKLIQVVRAAKLTQERSHRLFKKFQGYKNLLARLYEAYIFIKQENISRAKRVLQNIVKVDFTKHILQSDVGDLTLETEIKYFLEILKDLSLYFEGHKEFENLIYYLGFNTSGKFHEALLEQFPIRLKMNTVRDLYGSHTYGRQYPFVWAPIVFEESSQVEYLKVLEVSKVYKRLKNQSDYLLFLRSLDGIQRDQKDLVLKQFEKMREGNSAYSKYIEFSLLEDDNFDSFLQANKLKNRTLLATAKRSYYKKLLLSGRLFEYALINLLELGDIQESYLPLIFKYENNRL